MFCQRGPPRVPSRPVPRTTTRPPRRAVTPAGLRTREALLDAGVVVAERHGLEGLSVNTVVAEAKLAKGTFYVHFADRSVFVDALHQRFYARVSEMIAGAVDGVPEGQERIATGMEAYLDACLADRGIKALLIETRSDANLTTTIAERERLFARLIEPSARAMGWRNPAIPARLLVAMTSEAALQELEAGKRLPAVRATLRRFVALAAKGDR